MLIGSLAKECGLLDEIVHHKTILELHPQVYLNVQLMMLLTCLLSSPLLLMPFVFSIII